MEYFDAVIKSIEILKSIWPPIHECLNYKNILREKMLTLTKKMEMMNSLEDDINTKVKNEMDFDGKKKKKKEVETWLRNAQARSTEVHNIEQEVDKKRYFSRLQFLRLVEKNIEEVDELIKEGKFSEGIFIDVRQDQEDALVPIRSLERQSVYKTILEFSMNNGITKIGVYGMGGVGKTTLMIDIHNQLLEHTASTFDHVYWVTVSQESSIYKLQDDIAKLIQLNLSDYRDERKRAAQLFRELKKRKKFVLILDDMWNALPPDEVGIPIGVNSGKIIVTTRSLEVCQAMKLEINIKVDPLSGKDAWDLFMETLQCESLEHDPDVEKIARSIVVECAGLPLAIITTAGSLRSVNDIHRWRDALTELREPTKGLSKMESKVFKSLKLSYDCLNEKLQKCLLYCTLFPKDYKIQIVYLIGCWIVEGLVDEMKTRQEEFDRGYTLLKKLESACLLECTTDSGGDSGEVYVKMQSVIRDMAIIIASENSQFMVKAGVQLTELPDESEWSENVERVSLMHNNIRGQLSDILPNCPILCTLMLQSNCYIQGIPDSLFIYMQNLILLDLSYLDVQRLPDSISKLEKLRALLLNNCKALKYIPSLEKLRELRELDLWLTKIQKLPDGMEKLVKLRRLDFHHISNGYVFPSGVLLNLSHLQCLRLAQFNITDDVHMEEISSLKKLEILAARFDNLPVFNRYVKTERWQKLSHYSLQAVNSNLMVPNYEVRCREVHLSKHNLIQGGEDPLVLPTNIQELSISSCHDFTSLSDISSSLENAKDFERCRIIFCEGIEYLWCTNTNTSLLQSLRTLMLSQLKNLSVLFNFKGVAVGGAPPRGGTFSNLKLFSVGECPNLKYVFMHGLVENHLQNLEVIHVYQCATMENIIAVEEEENNSIIACPKLQRLELEYLPKLTSIWRGTMDCHSLQIIEVTRCPMLKRLPLSLPLQPSSTLKNIIGEQDWWDLLKWDQPIAKSVFQPLFDTKTSTSTIFLRALEIWDHDAERYK